MVQTRVPLPVRSFGQTKRPDAWWVYPLLTFLGLSAFVVYSTWAAFQGKHYTYGPYLSPFYSPELFGDSPHAWFGAAAVVVAELAAVLAGAADPLGARPGSASPATTTAARTTRRSGPTRPPAPSASRARATSARATAARPPEHPPLLPVRRGAVHRHAGLRRDQGVLVPTRRRSFGIGVGTLVLIVNVILLGGYTFGCHSLRHLIGGRHDCSVEVADVPQGCTRLFELPEPQAHAVGVDEPVLGAFADLYVRLCSMGVWTDCDGSS